MLLSDAAKEASPYDDDSTVERMFPDEEKGLHRAVAGGFDACHYMSGRPHGAEEGVSGYKKRSLYKHYLDTQAELNSEAPATEEDVKHLLVGKITDIGDQMDRMEDNQHAAHARLARPAPQCKHQSSPPRTRFRTIGMF
jgi:hypothetical protein